MHVLRVFDKDSRKFWNNVYKVSNNKASSHVNSVGGATGPQDVSDMWKNHFQQLYSTGTNTIFHAMFEEKLKSCALDASSCLLTMFDIMTALGKQKRGKSPGPDGINMEAFMFSAISLSSI